MLTFGSGPNLVTITKQSALHASTIKFKPFVVSHQLNLLCSDTLEKMWWADHGWFSGRPLNPLGVTQVSWADT